MRRKITKGAKWFAMSLAGLTVLLLVLYWVAAEYYLPRYFQNNIIPELVKEAGIKGFSGRVTNVGAFGADLGKMTIGAPDNPTLKAERVMLTYSLRKSWQRGHLVVEQIVVSGVKLHCSMRNGKLIINGVDQEKFIAEIKKHFIKPKQKRLLSVHKIIVNHGELNLKIADGIVTVPFNLLLRSVSQSWNRLQAELKFTLGEDDITAQFDCDIARGEVKAEFKGSSSLKEIARLVSMTGKKILPVDGIYEGKSTFTGRVGWLLKPHYKISDFNITGSVFHGRIDTGRFALRSLNLPSGKKKVWSYSISQKGRKFVLQLSDCLLQQPVNAEISNISLETTPENFIPRRFYGDLKLPLKSFPIWRTLGIAPLYNINFDSYCQGEFNFADRSWKFSLRPRDGSRNNKLYEWFFKVDGNYLFATVKTLHITGQGRGNDGKIRIVVNLPEVNLSGFRKAVGLKNLTLDEKLRVALTPRLNFTVQHLEGQLAIAAGDAAWQGEHWSGAGIKINGYIDITPDLQLNHGNFELDIAHLKRQASHCGVSVADISARGGINFFLNGSGDIVLKSLDGKLTMADFDYQRAQLAFNVSKLKLQQRLEFDHQLVVARGKSQIEAEKAGIVTRSGRITWWKCHADSSITASDRYPPADRLLQSRISFRKAVYQAAPADKGTTTAGELQLQLPLTDNCVNGGIKLTGQLKQGWYFSHGRKWRVANLSLNSDITLDSGVKKWPDTEALHGNMQCDSFDFSSGDYYLKLKNLSLAPQLLVGRNSDGLPVPVKGQIKFATAGVAGGYQENLLNSAMLSGMVDYERQRKPLLNIRLRGEKLSLQSIINGSCLVPKFKLQSALTADNLFGTLQIEDGRLKLSPSGISGRGIMASIPFGWPHMPSGKSGSFRAAAIDWNGLSFANLELNLDTSDYGFLLKGNFTNNIASQANNFCFGKIVMPPADFRLDLDLSLPAYTVSRPINLGRFIPEWDGLNFSGSMAAKANISYGIGNGLHWQSHLTLKNATLASDKLLIKRLNTTLSMDSYNNGLATDQQASCASLHYGTFKIDNVQFKYSIDDKAGIKIGQNSFNWLGGEAFVRPFLLNNDFTVAALEAYCRKLPTAALLNFLGLPKVKCRGFLRGVIKATLQKSGLHINHSELSSMPEQAQLLQIADLNTLIKPVRNSVQEFTCQLFQTGFLYNWLKIDFAILPQLTRLAIDADGKAVTAPPFLYNYDNGTFKRCAPGKGNVAGEISIATTLTLPSQIVGRK